MAKETQLYRDMVEVLESNRRSSMTGVGPRDSDTELLIQLLQIHYQANLTADQLNKLRQINVESVTRARRKLQSIGKFPPDSPLVAAKRRLKSYEVQQTAPSETAAGLQRRIEQNA